MTIVVDVLADDPISDLVVAYAIRDPARTLINSSNTHLLGVDLSDFDGSTTISFTFEGLPLLNGMYEVDLGAHSMNGSVHYAQIDPAVRFAIVGPSHETGIAHLLVRGETL